MTERLARWSSRRPWLAIGSWIFTLVVALGIIAVLIGSALTTDSDVTAQTESKRAEALLDKGFPPNPNNPGFSDIIVVRPDQPATSPAVEKRIAALATELRGDGIGTVVTYYESKDKRLLSADGEATAVLIGLGHGGSIDTVVDAVDRLDSEPGYEAAVTGDETISADFDTLSQEDLRKGELFFGAPAALVILVLVFGAVVAGLIPLLLAIVAIIVALALTTLAGQVFELSVFVVNMLTGMGLALGIDYSLFILSRYREERVAGEDKHEAIGIAGATASRAVLFSGIAFVLAMIGMTLVPDTILRSLAVGAILVGIVSVAAALTLMPAILSLLGDRVNRLRVPIVGRTSAGESRFWSTIVRRVMRRPVVSLVVAVGLLLAAASPVFALKTGQQGVSTMPDRFESKRGYLLLNQEFPGQTAYPVQIVVQGDASSPAVRQGVARLRSELATREIFGQPIVNADRAGDLTVLVVPIAGDADSEAATSAVEDLRSDLIPTAFQGVDANVLVGGHTAETVDYERLTSHWLPLVFVFVLGLSFILLTIAFRSLVVPATAILMNLLSVGAAYGLLVLVFLKGYGNEIFGFQQVDSVAAWVPLFLFSVLFGLSMDYQVFLLSRIRERFSATGDNRGAVSFGVGSTARLITGAALIIIAVFSGFARGDLVMFQQMGFGVAVALLIDATVIRSAIVPASMALLGRWNWYLPTWLGWLPDVHVEGAGPQRRETALPELAQAGSSAP
jgi:putative drug exporter of the RND superfamily